MAKVDDIIEAFRSAAIEKGDFAESGHDQQLHLRMRLAFCDLQRLGDPSEAAFRQLLRDVSPHVRSWVATELLSRGDPDARRVLEDLAGGRGLLAFAASTTLEEYHAGRLRSPF